MSYWTMPLPGLLRGLSRWPLGTLVPEQGGYYIGTILDGGKNYALFLANKTQGQSSSLLWKTSDTPTSGTDSLTNGLANLAGMVAAGITLHPAGQFCKNLTIGSKTDWYFPARDELDVIYTNRMAIVGVNAIDVDATYYWASSERSADAAWIQQFSSGSRGGGIKTDGYRVRAVRRLEI